KQKVADTAEELAKSFWEARNEFEFIAPTTTLEKALDKAIASNKKPFFISDMGDNPTAGGAGDVTWTLREILQHSAFSSDDGLSLIYASIPDSDFVKKAVDAGVGGTVSGLAGAEVDDRYAPPIKLEGTVTAIEYGDRDAVIEVVVQIGSVHGIVTQKRKPYHREEDFTNLGLNPRKTDIVVVKIGYLVPELYEMQAGWIMALTPGGVDQNLERLNYERIRRPMFPLDEDMDDP